MKTTLATAIEAVADLVGDYLSGTCSSIGAAAGATLIDARLKDKSYNQDDYFNNKVIYITAGTGVAGDERYISDFTASSGTVTPYYAFSAQVPNASTYIILSKWTASDIRRALNRGIVDAYPWVARVFVDNTLTTQDDTWSYRLGDYGTATYTSVTLTDTTKAWQTNQFAGLTVQSGANTATVTTNTATALATSTWSPSTPTSLDAYEIIHPIKDVLDVRYEVDTSNATYPYATTPFEVLEHEGTRIVQLRSYPPSGSTLRIIGKGPLTQFTTTTTSTTEIGEPHIKAIYYLAAYHLLSRSPSLVANQDREFYLSEAQRYYALWERERAQRKTASKPKRLWAVGMGGEDDGSELSYLAANDTPGTS